MRQWARIAAPALLALATCGDRSGPDPEVTELLAELEAFEAEHFDFRDCPTMKKLSLDVEKVRALDSRGVWRVASTADQTIALFPTVNLAGPLGLASLPTGTYVAVVLHVRRARLTTISGRTHDVEVRRDRVLLLGRFLVAPGRAIVFVPDVDPDKAVHCFRDVDCERNDDHGRPDDHHGDGDHHGGGDHDGDRDGHRVGGFDHRSPDRDDHGHGGPRPDPHHNCRCDVKVKFVLKPVFKILGQKVDTDGDGIPDAVDNCPVTPNAGQQDGDRDGLGDACDGCAGGADADNDGVCDANDNCTTASNVDQIDIDGDQAGDRCDTQRCYTPVSPLDRQLATQLALSDPRIQQVIANGHFRVLEFRTVCAERGATAARRIGVAVYDYTTNLSSDLVANLDTAAVDSFLRRARHPAISSEERTEAQAIADADSGVQAAVAAASLPPESALRSYSNGGRAALCASPRCVTIVYAASTGGSATFPTPEPYGAGSSGFARWKGVVNLFSATVDLSGRNVVEIKGLER